VSIGQEVRMSGSAWDPSLLPPDGKSTYVGSTACQAPPSFFRHLSRDASTYVALLAITSWRSVPLNTYVMYSLLFRLLNPWRGHGDTLGVKKSLSHGPCRFSNFVYYFFTLLSIRNSFYCSFPAPAQLTNFVIFFSLYLTVFMYIYLALSTLLIISFSDSS
jgi:hypothetical protein